MSNWLQRYPPRGLFCLLLVYIVWGSTYLGIRYAVREGSGFPPFSMAAARALAGGLILLGLGLAFRHRLRITRRDFGLLLLSSILLWNGGNGLDTWAEQRAHSAFAALAAGTTADLWATVALLSWSIGSAIQLRNPLGLSTFASSGYQQLFGTIGFFVLLTATGEPTPQPTAEAWWAWGYLVIFGSVIGFTSFVYALRTLPVPVVMTYGFVNPVIAVFLGWFFLGEAITPTTLAGTALILAGVGGVFREKHAAR